jgi:hypothetical protein
MDRDALRILAGIKPASAGKNIPGIMVVEQGPAMDKNALRTAAGIPTKNKPVVEAAPVAEGERVSVKPGSTLDRSPKTHYEGSHEFDGEVSQIASLLKKAMKIIDGPKMQQHIKDTKQNYVVDTSSEAAGVKKALEAADAALEKFYNKMGTAE